MLQYLKMKYHGHLVGSEISINVILFHKICLYIYTTLYDCEKYVTPPVFIYG